MSTRTKRRMTNRKTYRVRETLICSGCKGEIAPFEPFWRGLTKEPWHRDCKRLGVNVSRPTAPRYLQDPAVGQDCGGCGMKIYNTDTVVHVVTVPWHKECFLRR